MEAYQWFLLGVMAGFIPSLVVFALIVGRARRNRRDRADHDNG
jgi:Na+-translocating ferredoxin:NAD+ oxidoreductase RnfE subunit